MTENTDGRELPKGWVWACFGDLADHRLGKMLDKNKNVGVPRPYLRNINVRWHGFDLDDVFEMRIGDEELDKYTVRKGDLVICEGGEPGRAAIWHLDKPFAYQKALHRARSYEGVEARYLLYVLEDSAASGRLADHFTGSTINHLTGRALADVLVPLAPLAEQRRIVGKIEELFSDLDAGVQALETVRRQLARYRQSVLKAAVEGDLTRDWRAAHADAEPAPVLLARILEERRARWEADTRKKYEARGKTPPKDWQNRYSEPAAPDTADLPELPEGWTWSNMDALLSGIKAGKSFKCEERPPKGGEVGLVKVSAVSWGEYKEGESKTCFEEEQVNPDYFIQSGDFLFSRANTIELVGACVIVQTTSKRLMLSDKILRFDLIQVVNDWILYVLRSQHGRQQIEALATGNQASMRNIGQDRIRAICAPLPPLTEQEAIVEAVEERLSVADAVAAEVDRQLRRAEKLRRSILQRAFEGRLVPQDPTDEPASRLLARIEAEKQPKPRKARAQQTEIAFEVITPPES